MLETSKQAYKGGALPLTALNHVSIVCRSLDNSLDFYQDVLGFIPVRRPRSFDFDGAWLFNYGIGIHLLQSEDPERMPEKRKLNPKDNHISFQCDSMVNVEKKLKEMEMPYIRQRVEESGINIDQLFFHDPDGFMIEICNCEKLPVIPLTAGETLRVCKTVSLMQQQQQQQQQQQELQQQQQQQQQMVQCLPLAITINEEPHISCA